MNVESISTIIAGSGFAVAGLATYLHLRHRVKWLRPVLRVAIWLALSINIFLGASEIRDHGLVQATQFNDNATILLATLIGTVGVIACWSGALRGLDGFLFTAAAITQFASLLVTHEPYPQATSRAWFISHPLAFALSGTFFAAAGAAGIAYLLVYRMLRRKRATTLVGRVASLEALERFGRWMPILGFPLFTYGILTGFCGVAHRRDISESAWYFDPSFLFSVLAWFVYAYLCLGVLYRPSIRGRKAAALATYGLGLVVMVFLAREFLSPMHQ